MGEKAFIFIAACFLGVVMICQQEVRAENKDAQAAKPAGMSAEKSNNMFAQKITTAAKINTMRVKEVVKISVKVKNLSSQIWPGRAAEKSVRLSYYWIDSETKKPIMKGGRPRIYLPNDLVPKKSATLKINVVAPEKPGKYILRFTMVQEHVAWFENKGAKTLDIPVTITQ